MRDCRIRDPWAGFSPPNYVDALLGAKWLSHAKSLAVCQHVLGLLLSLLPVPHGMAFAAAAQTRTCLRRRCLAHDLVETVGRRRRSDLYCFLYGDRWSSRCRSGCGRSGRRCGGGGLSCLCLRRICSGKQGCREDNRRKRGCGKNMHIRQSLPITRRNRPSVKTDRYHELPKIRDNDLVFGTGPSPYCRITIPRSAANAESRVRRL